MKSIISTLGLAAAGVVAQENLKIEDRIFLTSSHPEAGLINYVELYHDTEESGVGKLVRNGNWRPLITGLGHPTHTVYDFANKVFYVCNCDEILQYQVKIVESNGEDVMYANEPKKVANDVKCGGLALDKFNNLLYVDQNT